MIGLGYYGTITPAVIRRNVLENPAWYTAYTPYQPEISQGRLEALLNFQTMVCDLTALAGRQRVAARRGLGRGRGDDPGPPGRRQRRGRDLPRRRRLPAADPRRAAHPGRAARHRAAGRAGHRGAPTSAASSACCCSTRARPARSATSPRSSRPRTRPGATVAVAADMLALTLLKPPGELGADIALGTTQRFGVPMFYGGPHAAYLAVREDLQRQLPGRLVGVSVDADGRPALPAGAAGPRAAHPPGEGHQQHLHRPGAARGGRLHVRGATTARTA